MSATRPPKYSRQREKNRADRAFVRINGKKIKLGVFGSPESKTRYAELIAKPAEEAPPAPPSDPTVTELMAAYIDHVDVYYGHKSAEWYHARSFYKLLRLHYGDLPARGFKAKKLKELREHWIKNDWSRKYVNEHVARLKRMYKWATSEISSTSTMQYLLVERGNLCSSIIYPSPKRAAVRRLHTKMLTRWREIQWRW